jgi:hypothetical protein
MDRDTAAGLDLFDICHQIKTENRKQKNINLLIIMKHFECNEFIFF